ncbi:hypothetical protein BJX62DRAFT_211558 [Aspergillus germanicus]
MGMDGIIFISTICLLLYLGFKGSSRASFCIALLLLLFCLAFWRIGVFFSFSFQFCLRRLCSFQGERCVFLTTFYVQIHVLHSRILSITLRPAYD